MRTCKHQLLIADRDVVSRIDKQSVLAAQGGLPLVCPLRCQGALTVVPNHTLRRMVEVLAPADRGQPPAERAYSTILTHDDAAGGIVPALRRARSSLKRPASGAHIPGAPSALRVRVLRMSGCEF